MPAGVAKSRSSCSAAPVCGNWRPGRKSVGRQNIEAALAVLRQEGFAPRTSDTGGTEGRKLRFYSATGEVFVKRIRMEADG